MKSMVPGLFLLAAVTTVLAQAPPQPTAPPASDAPSVSQPPASPPSTVPPATAPAALTAREAHRLGNLEKDKKARRAYFQTGIDKASLLLAKNEDDPEGLLWMAANIGSEALTRGKLKALNVLPEMEKLLLRLDEVAPEYDGAAASRVLGNLYDTAPKLISIGSKKKARAAYEKALRLAPDHPGNQALAAKFFWDEGPKDQGLELARAVLQNPALDQQPEAAEWRKCAQDIVSKGETQ